jgi:GT2 family glycosyltransferase
MALDVSVGIVNWNHSDQLIDCLEHLMSIGVASDCVWVLDNGSLDGSAVAVRTFNPLVNLLVSQTNLGFAAGVNLVVKAAGGDAVLLLNPDARPEPGTIDALAAHLRDHPDTAAVGPQMTDPAGVPITCHDRFPTLPSMIADQFRIRKTLPIHDRPANVDWVGGGCFMVSTRAFDAIGEFDSAYFMYSEELDWCQRAAQLGWKIACRPDVKAVHREGGSGGVGRRAQISRAKILYLRKHSGKIEAQILGSVMVARHLFALLAHAVRHGPRHTKVRSHAHAFRACLNAVVDRQHTDYTI